MVNIINWIKSNKVLSLILAFILFWLLSNINLPLSNRYSNSRDMYIGGVADSYTAEPQMMGMMAPSTKSYNYAPESVSPSSDRKVITDNSTSLVVKNVSEASNQISNKTTELGGFVVNTYISRPEESANGNLRIRIPVAKSQEFIKFAESISVKVVSFNTSGNDVTDQYRDLDARLEVLQESYDRIEAIYKSATDVTEMLTVQNQLFSLQDQIDSIIGQKEYIENTTNTTAFTIYLSEDEYSLPYAPEGQWRPEVVYKLAVRSLITDVRGLGSSLIWIGVYAVLWLPVIVVLFAIYPVVKRKNKNQKIS